MTQVDSNGADVGKERGEIGSGSGGGHKSKFKIRIDRTEFEVEAKSLTGSQIRALPRPPIGADRDLFEVVPGSSDRKVEIGTVVEMRDGLRFFTAPAQINPGA